VSDNLAGAHAGHIVVGCKIVTKGPPELFSLGARDCSQRA